MSYATGTTHYNLPQTVGTDKRDWADTNQSFSDIDAAIYGAVSDVATAGTAISGLETRMTTAEGNISDNAANITSLDTRMTTAEGAITSLGSRVDDVGNDLGDMICAYNEASATSTHSYNIGDYFRYNDVLYRATQSIAIGDTIVPDTNCMTTNVTSELINIIEDIPAIDNIASNNLVTSNVESGMSASRNYSVGDYIIVQDTLYRVIAAISTGATLVPNSNVVATNIVSDFSHMIKVKSGTISAGSTWATNLTNFFSGTPDLDDADYRIVITLGSLEGTVYSVKKYDLTTVYMDTTTPYALTKTWARPNLANAVNDYGVEFIRHNLSSGAGHLYYDTTSHDDINPVTNGTIELYKLI